MRYYYQEYCFDSTTFTLYRDEQPQALKTHQAQLLAFFIEHSDEILSKEQILDRVWTNQDVSEQVVFQNISQLRSLFGSGAIKTFPKKGYQWQLPFAAVNANTQPHSTTSIKRVFQPTHVVIAVVSVILLALVMWFVSQSNIEQSRESQVYLVPFSSHSNDTQAQLTQLNDLVSEHSSSANDSLETSSLFNFPEIIKQTTKLDSNSALLSGYLSTFGDQLLLEYTVLGSKRNWTGYAIANNEQALTKSLKSTVDSVLAIHYLDEPNEALLAAKLTLLLEQQPNDKSVIYHLLIHELRKQNYDVANALIERLLNASAKNSPYTALALLVKGGIYHEQQAIDDARKYYSRAISELKDHQFSEIRYKLEVSLAWLAYEQKSPQSLRQHVLNAAQSAQQRNNVLAQVSAYTSGSILSHKLGDLVNRYQYLNTAKSLLITHEIPEAYFAIIEYHLGLFAADKVEAESYYLKVLALPKIKKYQWLYESATEDLLTWYIDNKQWQQALSLFESQPENSFNLSQKARVLHAKHDYSAAIRSAKRAFDQARLDYQHNNSLHAALLLYQLQAHLSDPNTSDYERYIRQNASDFWLNKHQDELNALGYFDGAAP